MKNLVKYLIVVMITSFVLLSCKKYEMTGCKCIHTDNEGNFLYVCGNTDVIAPYQVSEVMFPNPAQNFIHLEFRSSEEKTVTIKKKMGKELYRKTTYQDLLIDIGDFPVGKYVLTVDYGDTKSKWCLFKE